MSLFCVIATLAGLGIYLWGVQIGGASDVRVLAYMVGLCLIASSLHLFFHCQVRVPVHEMAPAFYGQAWFDAETSELVCMPIPFNLLFGMARRLYYFCKGGVAAPTYYRELRMVRLNRKAHADYLRGIHSNPDVPEAVKRHVRDDARASKIPLDDITGNDPT